MANSKRDTFTKRVRKVLKTEKKLKFDTFRTLVLHSYQKHIAFDSIKEMQLDETMYLISYFTNETSKHLCVTSIDEAFFRTQLRACNSEDMYIRLAEKYWSAFTQSTKTITSFTELMEKLQQAFSGPGHIETPKSGPLFKRYNRHQMYIFIDQCFVRLLQLKTESTQLIKVGSFRSIWIDTRACLRFLMLHHWLWMKSFRSNALDTFDNIAKELD